MRALWVFGFLGLVVHAGSFEKYQWRLGFLQTQDFYQMSLKITYDYRTEGQFDPAVLALPNDNNLKIQSLTFTVDGKEVEPIDSDQTTYWSYGRPVPTWLPSQEGQRIKASAVFLIKNAFLIPPAPTNLPVAVGKLEVGFAPIRGFNIAATFIGPSYPFESIKIPARPGEAPRAYFISRKKLPAATEQELMFLIPRSFTFSFSGLQAAQWEPEGRFLGKVGGTGGALQAGGSDDLDADAGARNGSMTGDLKPYTAAFYTGDPARDWAFSLTWLQQERIYLPFGILPGGRVKGRNLFRGAGAKHDDLISWYDTPVEKSSDAAVAAKEPPVLPTLTVEAITEKVTELDLFLGDFRRGLKIDPRKSRLVANEEDGTISPAMANRMLTNELIKRYNVKAVPVLISPFPQERISGLPLSAFERLITGVRIGKNWFFADASALGWRLSEGSRHLKGHSMVILDEEQIKLGSM